MFLQISNCCIYNNVISYFQNTKKIINYVGEKSEISELNAVMKNKFLNKLFRIKTIAVNDFSSSTSLSEAP